MGIILLLNLWDKKQMKWTWKKYYSKFDNVEDTSPNKNIKLILLINSLEEKRLKLWLEKYQTRINNGWKCFI